MGRILTTVLSLYWAAAFAASAFGRLGAERVSFGGVGHGWTTAGHVAMAMGSALVAALFLWLLVSAVLDDGIVPGGTDEVATLAFGGAALMLTVTLGASLFPAGRADIAAPVSLAALLASYLVMHVERRYWGRPPAAEARRIRAAARVMALSAVHDSMISRLAYPIVPANDERVR